MPLLGRYAGKMFRICYSKFGDAGVGGVHLDCICTALGPCKLGVVHVVWQQNKSRFCNPSCLQSLSAFFTRHRPFLSLICFGFYASERRNIERKHEFRTK